MKMSDLKNKTDKELLILLRDSRERVRVERFKDKFGRKPSVVRSSKLTIAQILTELNSRRIAGKN